MKKKSPTYFAFETPLSIQILFEQLPEATREYNSIYYSPYSDLRCEIPRGSQNRFRIGIERAGHSIGGYWYCATIEEIEHGCRITGNIVFNPDENDIGEDPPSPSLWERISFVFFFILLLIPIVLCWIGLGIYSLYRWIRRLPRELNKEKKLVDFMTKHLSCQVIERS